MTDADLTPFLVDVYRPLRHALLHKRLTDDDEGRQETAYFSALRRYPLRDVRIAADELLRSAKSFPAPAEWIAALPRSRSDLRQATASELRDYQHAAALGWVDAEGRRFVPTVDVTGAVEQAVTASGQVVAIGHWAEGDELSRWTLAHDDFLRRLRRDQTRWGLRLVATREPGEDD